MDVDIQQAPSETSSSHTEMGSPVETHFRKTERRPHKSRRQDQNTDLRELFKAITRVVIAIQNQSAKTEGILETGSLKRKIEKSAPVLKGTPENGAEILGSFLTLSAILDHGSIPDDLAVEDSLLAFVSIWKSSIYGHSSAKKASLTPL